MSPFFGLRTVIYPAADLEAAKHWYTQALGFPPYFDQPFYVGFQVGGYAARPLQQFAGADRESAFCPAHFMSHSPLHYPAMRNILVLSLIAFTLYAFPACNNASPVDRSIELEASLLQLDADMTATNGTLADTAKAAAFIRTAEEYAALVQPTNPDKYADLLLKAAGVAKSGGNSAKALELYATVAEKMPQHPKAPMALFMEGFILENDRGDTAMARVRYQAFLAKYPNDPDFADDAQNALKNLGKSPEEMIRQFEAQNKNRPQ